MGRIIAENKHTGKLYPVDSKAIYRVIYEVVDVLPAENIKTSVIYCVPIVGKENEYDMFLYIDSNWVSVGSGSIDLSDYYTKEETAELLSDKMDLAPLNPTAEQIASLPSGQLYSDTANHKGIIKGGQEFYDTVYIDDWKTIEIELSYLNPNNPSDGYLVENYTKKELYDLVSNTEAEIFFFIKETDSFNTIRIGKLIQASGYTNFENKKKYRFTLLMTDVHEYGAAQLSLVQTSGTSDFYDESNDYPRFETFYQIPTTSDVNTLLRAKENTSNKVRSLSAQSTDTQYPSAKCVYDMIGDVETLLSQV